MADAPRNPAPVASLFEFAEDSSGDGDSAQECLQYVLRAELDELAKEDHEASDKFLKQIKEYENYHLIATTKLSRAEKRDPVVEDRKINVNERIGEMEKQEDDLKRARNGLENQHKAVRWMRRRFTDLVRSGSVFVFRMRSREEKLMQEISDVRRRRKEKMREIDDHKRRTPGRKSKVEKTTPRYITARDIAMQQARHFPRLKPLSNPMDEKDNKLTWHKTSRIYKGGFGGAQVCVGVDGDRKIVKRIVEKTTQVGDIWRTPNMFRGELRGNGPLVPLEWLTQTLATSADGGARSILPIVGTAKYDDQTRSYTIWVPFAPCRDLGNVIKSHQIRGMRLPEPFLFYVFKTLVEAGLVMKQCSSTAGSPAQGWQEEIVHRDLKPDNIFLDLPDDKHFRSYPSPKVADFGLAFMTWEADQTNPYYWAAAVGSPGYMPGELISWEDPKTLKPVDDFKILSPCNVWGIGAIMLKLLDPTFEIEETQLSYIGPPANCRYRVPVALRTQFSIELCQLVDACLVFDPDQRATLEHLQMEIDRLINEDDFMKNSNAGHSHSSENQHKLLYAQEEEYALGLVYEPSLLPDRRRWR